MSKRSHRTLSQSIGLSLIHICHHSCCSAETQCETFAKNKLENIHDEWFLQAASAVCYIVKINRRNFLFPNGGRIFFCFLVICQNFQVVFATIVTIVQIVAKKWLISEQILIKLWIYNKIDTMEVSVMKKFLIALAAVLTLTASLLVGCDGGGGAPASLENTTWEVTEASQDRCV